MLTQRLALTFAAVFLANAVAAASFDIHMKNKGAQGAMVFEPAFVQAAPGDTINFIVDDKGHNVESIVGMVPDGAEAFKSKLNQQFSITLTVEGLYGVKCTPHYLLGMVALIQVGAASNYDAAAAVKQLGKAKTRFEPLLAQVVK